ncbi:sugar ABC transporter permease [Collibacillus ludicampi]|jgi:sorbitol/mannitol transport system permease protein|uniref:Sugar ABC transporter permease n=1 Tax=Collibacillus ludicampi TaxID=2771369 RepID=A0AAV4LGD1_9BACL|nr:sugar ABC transporter permease [Collibacillus ludicampi]GIM46723.1 sugar ABC transporter permease [Collibacillus ludicampi]
MKTVEVIEPVQTNIKRTPRKKSISTPPVKRLLWPSLIFVGIVTQIPFIFTVYYSFHEWNLMRPDKGISFAGFSNFRNIIKDPAFGEILKNTFLLTVVPLLLCLILGMALALLLNRNFFGKGFIRTMLVSPFFVMPAVSGIVWKTMILNPNFGFSSYLASVLGTQPADWLAKYPLEMIMLMVSWQWTPFFMLVLLAGLQSVPGELLEASLLDGASRIHQFFYVIVPHLLRYIEVVALLGLIFIMQTFGEIYVSTAGGPGYTSTNLPFYVYRIGFQGWDVGGASAVGVIIVIITTIFMTLLFKFLRRTFGGELS